MSNYHLCLRNQDCKDWLCWLQPDDEVSGEAKREKNKPNYKDLVIASVSGTDETLLGFCPELVAGLERIEQYFVNRCERAQFERVFQNASLVTAWQRNPKNPFQTFVKLEVPHGKPGKWAQIALFKACYIYLLKEERYRVFDADIAFVYCAWQRYNLLKQFVPYKETQKASQQDEPITEPSYQSTDYEFAIAYRTLTELLEQDMFSYAFHVLWRYGWRGGESDNLSNPLIRERLRVSMVLSEKKRGETSAKDAQQSNPKMSEKPFDAPLCFRTKAEWQRVRIHPWFTNNKRAKATVRRLIRNWLLPRYSLGNAFYLAAKLTDKMWWMRFLIALGVTVVFFVLILKSIENSFCVTQNTVALILQGIGPAILFIALLCVDIPSIPHLLLLRLCGGIFVGYLPLAIAQEPWLAVTLVCVEPEKHGVYELQWTNPWLIILLSSSILLAFFYFANEAFVYTNDKRCSVRRAFAVLIWAIIVAVFLGSWICQFGTPILESIDIDQKAEGFQSLDFWPILPGINVIFPWIHKEFTIPVPALLTFAPLALLIGIMVQIIWEEKPITATVWNPEER